MKNIKIETNFVRVMRNTTNPCIKVMDEMIGQELEVRESSYNLDNIYVWNKDKSDFWIFNKSDVRFLTAGMHKKNHIAIGDEVLVGNRWRKVTGFYMYDNRAKILTGTLADTNFWVESEIKNHRTGVTASLAGKEVDVIVDGVSYKAVIK